MRPSIERKDGSLLEFSLKQGSAKERLPKGSLELCLLGVLDSGHATPADGWMSGIDPDIRFPMPASFTFQAVGTGDRCDSVAGREIKLGDIQELAQDFFCGKPFVLNFFRVVEGEAGLECFADGF